MEQINDASLWRIKVYNQIFEVQNFLKHLYVNTSIFNQTKWKVLDRWCYFVHGVTKAVTQNLKVDNINIHFHYIKMSRSIFLLLRCEDIHALLLIFNQNSFVPSLELPNLSCLLPISIDEIIIPLQCMQKILRYIRSIDSYNITSIVFCN